MAQATFSLVFNQIHLVSRPADYGFYPQETNGESA